MLIDFFFFTIGDMDFDFNNVYIAFKIFANILNNINVYQYFQYFDYFYPVLRAKR